MKRTHGLDEKEMELAKLLMVECHTTGDIHAKQKNCLQERSSRCLKLKWLNISVTRRIPLTEITAETVETATGKVDQQLLRRLRNSSTVRQKRRI